jgi:hypothetical protein
LRSATTTRISIVPGLFDLGCSANITVNLMSEALSINNTTSKNTATIVAVVTSRMYPDCRIVIVGARVRSVGMTMTGSSVRCSSGGGVDTLGSPRTQGGTNHVHTSPIDI